MLAKKPNSLNLSELICKKGIIIAICKGVGLITEGRAEWGLWIISLASAFSPVCSLWCFLLDDLPFVPSQVHFLLQSTAQLASSWSLRAVLRGTARVTISTVGKSHRAVDKHPDKAEWECGCSPTLGHPAACEPYSPEGIKGLCE